MRRPSSIASGVSTTRARLRPSPRLRPKRGPCTMRPSRSRMCALSWYGSPVLKAKKSSVTEIDGIACGRDRLQQIERAAEFLVKDGARQVVAARRAAAEKEPAAQPLVRLVDRDVAPGTSAFRMRSAAAASPPNPPPTICAFIGPLPSLRVGDAEAEVSKTARRTSRGIRDRPEPAAGPAMSAVLRSLRKW